MIDFALWGLPQWIYVSISLMGLVICGFLHGEPRKPLNIGDIVLSTIIGYSLLIWGGFFS